jgi:hypothetical protein
MNAYAIYGWPIFREVKLAKHMWPQVYTGYYLTFDDRKVLPESQSNVRSHYQNSIFHLHSDCLQISDPI